MEYVIDRRNFMNYYDQIKKEFINHEIYQKAKDYSKNKNDLMTYYNASKLLVETQGAVG